MSDASGEEPRSRWASTAALAVAICGAGLYLWLGGPDGAPPAPDAPPTATPPALDPGPATQAAGAGRSPVGAPAPKVVIPEKGRLSVQRDDLREGDVLVLGLAMSDDARGDGALSTRIVEVSGERAFDVEARSIAGSGTGVRIEIDPERLPPGTYMIQVQTQNASHFPFRRYVLTVE